MKIILNPENHEYAVAGKVKISVTQVLAENGLSDFVNFINPLTLERAMKFGKAVHTACEYHDRGILNYATVDKAIIPYLEGWKKYLKEWEVEILEIEKSHYSKAWNFCGTPDRIVLERGLMTLPDIKSVTTLGKSVGLQLAGYKILADENKQKIKNRVAVQLKEDGTYKRVPYKEKSDVNVFKSMLTTYGWKLNNGYIKKGE